jgi:hypothetical protein
MGMMEPACDGIFESRIPIFNRREICHSEDSKLPPPENPG